MPGVPSSTPVRSASADDGLVLAPFRGLRYDPSRVSSLAAVTSPPYDVLDDDDARRLAIADPHNIVRLILPRRENCGPEGPYERAAQTLRAWIADGTLRRDREPAIYVLEQAAPGVQQWGLLGALELRPASDRVVLPHEDVMPGPVEDRLRLLRATEANLEPIFLVYDGRGGDTAALTTHLMSNEAPVISTTTADGITHRVWQLADRERLEAVSADLRPRQALIADGHHRYATYLRFQAERHRRVGPGPWDRGLSLLVDSSSAPPHLTSIARVVPGLSFSDAVRQLGPLARATTTAPPAGDTALETTHAGVDDVVRRLMNPGNDDGSLLLVGSEAELAMVSILDSAWGNSAAAEFLHRVLLPRWHVVDPDTEVIYMHDIDAAIQLAKESGGVAMIPRPPTVSHVLQVARSGRTMPRKSTSFGPKPRDGLVLRSLNHG